MSYRATILIPGMLQPDKPHILCDGCGVKYYVVRRGNIPGKWFFDGKPPRGWLRRDETVSPTRGIFRRDYCQKCKAMFMPVPAKCFKHGNDPATCPQCEELQTKDYSDHAEPVK